LWYIERVSGTTARRRLQIALWVGAALWFFLVLAGFFAPGGWTWGLPGPTGHMENYVISLWIVALVLAPLLAARDPERNTVAIQVYMLGIFALLISTIRGEMPKLLADAPPWGFAIITLGLLVWAHPRPSSLLRL
jgi:hypothetical protein